MIAVDINKDPAFPVMVMDILSNMLSRADNPSSFGTYLTEEILGLTGARCIVLIQYMDNKKETGYRILNVNPARRREWAEALATRHLSEVVRRSTATQLIHAEEQTEIAEYLRQAGLGLSMTIPLHLGDLCIGTMLILGLPDELHISSVLGLLNNLSTVVALVLRNSFLFESQEQIIQERTEALRTVNEQLRSELAERKAAEEALCQLNTELDRRVLERTAELEAANKEMHAFTYTVSHDLRAPLRHIDGFIELLQKNAGTALDEHCWHYMEAISGAAQKMGLLIDDLLSFSRMGRHAISFQQVELGTLVREVIRELEPDTAGRNIAWCIGDLPAVGGDASLLRIVLGNLIANALKFTRSRQQARIDIGLMPGQTPEAVIFVRDNGVGFDMTYVDKLFGVFQRLHRSDEFEGTGIGLASVHRIITRHGGRIWAEGQINQGAAFYFALPRALNADGDGDG